MDDLKITNEMVKEHLMGLCLDKNIQGMFDKIETRTKASFTKEYNKSHQEIKRVGTQKGKKGAKDE